MSSDATAARGRAVGSQAYAHEVERPRVDRRRRVRVSGDARPCNHRWIPPDQSVERVSASVTSVSRASQSVSGQWC